MISKRLPARRDHLRFNRALMTSLGQLRHDPRHVIKICVAVAEKEHACDATTARSNRRLRLRKTPQRSNQQDATEDDRETALPNLQIRNLRITKEKDVTYYRDCKSSLNRHCAPCSFTHFPRMLKFPTHDRSRAINRRAGSLSKTHPEERTQAHLPARADSRRVSAHREAPLKRRPLPVSETGRPDRRPNDRLSHPQDSDRSRTRARGALRRRPYALRAQLQTSASRSHDLFRVRENHRVFLGRTRSDPGRDGGQTRFRNHATSTAHDRHLLRMPA